MKVPSDRVQASIAPAAIALISCTNIMMRWAIALTMAVLAAAAPYTWTSVKFGGGGIVSGMTFHPKVQGLLYARTDGGGAYRRDPGSTTWTPLNDDLGRDDSTLMSVLSLAVDANDASKLYLACGSYLGDWAPNGAFLKSSDRGATWSRVALGFRLGGKEPGSGTAERLQVDPNLGSVLWLGTSQDGLWRSTDSGATWSRVTAFPGASTTFVVLDPRSGLLGAATPTVYVGIVNGTAPSLYQTTDGGTTWTPTPDQPIGLTAINAALDGIGGMFVTFGNSIDVNHVSTGAVYRYHNGGVWDDVTPPIANAAGWGGVAVSVTDPTLVYVSTIGRWWPTDDIFQSFDGGLTWTALNAVSHRSAPSTPWMRANFQSDTALGFWVTDIELDPFADDHLLYNTNYGLWETEGAFCRPIDWLFATDGLEQAVTYALASPPSGAHLFVGSDMDGARYDTDFTSVNGYFPGHGTCYSVDYAHNLPSFVARTVADDNHAYLSWDNGVTWQPVGSQTPMTGALGSGRIALAADATAIVWAPSGASSAFVSVDNGVSWTRSVGYPDTKFEPIADRNSGNVFYTYDYDTGRLFESANSGRNFTVLFTGLDVLPFYAASHTLLSVPTQRRDLWLGTDNGLYHIDGTGATSPVIVAGVQSAWGVAAGAAAPGAQYPALYISGKVGNVVGLFRSVDKGASWTRINDDKHQFNVVEVITADQRVYGEVFIGGGGRGVLHGKP